MLVKDFIRKGNIQNQPYSQSVKGKNKPIFYNLNNYDLYITKKKKMFLMQEMDHGIKDGRIKMAKHKANAMQSNIIIRN
jgi:hypothetical protein